MRFFQKIYCNLKSKGVEMDVSINKYIMQFSLPPGLIQIVSSFDHCLNGFYCIGMRFFDSAISVT